MTLTVKTLKHVPIDDVLVSIGEELHDLVIEVLQNSSTSWGSNAETFITTATLLNTLEIALEEYADADIDRAPDAAEKAAYDNTVAALRNLPADVFISLGG